MDRGDGSIKYILSGEGAGIVFTIDDTTGDIHAIQRLDREERSQYTLRAQALDRRTGRPMEPESEFIIKIQDINDNEPKFLDGPYVASVPEMSPVGKTDFVESPSPCNQPRDGHQNISSLTPLTQLLPFVKAAGQESFPRGAWLPQKKECKLYTTIHWAPLKKNIYEGELKS